MLSLAILIRKGLQVDGITFEETRFRMVLKLRLHGSMMDGDSRNINEFTISVQLQETKKYWYTVRNNVRKNVINSSCILKNIHIKSS
jgi:hypothetical protein